jgi:L,D-transpeptidase ErfK/SrfK
MSTSPVRLILWWLPALLLTSNTPSAPPALVGSVSEYRVSSGDTLTGIGARFGVEAATIAADNGLPRDARLSIGYRLQIDNRHIVPRLSSTLTINLAQRLLFLSEGSLIAAFPVAVGRPSWQTPVGAFTIVEKRYQPTWHVPTSIQEEMRRTGKAVVKSVPPGPTNPLGDYWLGLSLDSIGIHSTNEPSSIYQFGTHGCIRLLPAAAQTVFETMAVGTRGDVIYEPILLTRVDDRVFVEAHRDVYGRGTASIEAIRAMAQEIGADDLIDWPKAAAALNARAGIARDVTTSRPD